MLDAFATAFDAQTVAALHEALPLLKTIGACAVGFGTAALVGRATHRRPSEALRSAPAPRSLDETLRALTAAAGGSGPLDVIALSRHNPHLLAPTAESIALSRKYQRIERRLKQRAAFAAHVSRVVGAPLEAYRAARLRSKYAPAPRSYAAPAQLPEQPEQPTP